ncbi:MAG: hypothetical protein NVS3B3_21610 [Aquirhabdus sp.]
MRQSKKPNGSNKGVIRHTKLGGTVKAKNEKIFRCGVQHTSKFRLAIEEAGLGLDDPSATTQCACLLRILQYRGAEGINTLEGVACGFLRIATRIQELQADGHHIIAVPETVISADGLVHRRIARYILLKEAPIESPQRCLDLEVAA